MSLIVMYMNRSEAIVQPCVFNICRAISLASYLFYTCPTITINIINITCVNHFNPLQGLRRCTIMLSLY